MFASLISWLAGAFNWTSDAITEVWRVIKDFYGWWFGLIITAVGWLWLVLTWVTNSLTDVLEQIDALVFPTLSSGVPGPVSSCMALANTFFPVAELFAFLIAWLALMLTLSAYRLIKSWIPTLS